MYVEIIYIMQVYNKDWHTGTEPDAVAVETLFVTQWVLHQKIMNLEAYTHHSVYIMCQ